MTNPTDFQKKEEEEKRLTWNTMDFFRQEEEKLSGKAVKVPVCHDLLEDKIIFTSEHFMKYLFNLSALLQRESNDKFSKRVFSMISDIDFSRGCYYGLSPGIISDVLPCIFKQFLNKKYRPPITDHPTMSGDFIMHLQAYMFYLQTISSCGFIYPRVKDFIDFAGTKLIQASTAMIISIKETGTRQDGGKKPKKNKPILEAAKLYLKDNAKLSEMSNERIAKKFCNKYKESSPMNITVDGIECEVFSQDELIFSVTERKRGKGKDKSKERSISYTTFWQQYIRDAKKTISSL